MRYWSRIAQSIEPYVPGEQPQDQQYIKLNTNENPYPPSPRALEAIRREANDKLRLYPDPDCTRLREAFSSVMNIVPEEVFVGNGSDEVLSVAYQAFFDPDQSPILFPDISYSFYPVYANLYSIPFSTIPLAEDFSIRADDYMQPNGGIILPNPNAPTSRAMPTDEICRLLEYNRKIGRVIIIDEAYIAFGGQSMVDFIHEYDNLVVIMTLSKSYALAGLRGGFAIAQKPLVEAMDRIKNSFNSYTLDRLAIAGAAEAVLDQPYFNAITQKIIATRQAAAQGLEQLGFSVQPSSSNFLFACHPQVDGQQLYLQLKQRGILVRHFSTPRINQYIRITVGTDEQMQKLLQALADILQQG